MTLKKRHSFVLFYFYWLKVGVDVICDSTNNNQHLVKHLYSIVFIYDISGSHFSSLYVSTLSPLSSRCFVCGNMLWQDLQCATNSDTHTHIVSVPHMSTTPYAVPAVFAPADTWTQNTDTHAHTSTLAIKQPWTWAKLTAKAVWVMNQGKDQRGARDRWANASTARWCLWANKNLR